MISIFVITIGAGDDPGDDDPGAGHDPGGGDDPGDPGGAAPLANICFQ